MKKAALLVAVAGILFVGCDSTAPTQPSTQGGGDNVAVQDSGPCVSLDAVTQSADLMGQFASLMSDGSSAVSVGDVDTAVADIIIASGLIDEVGSLWDDTDPQLASIAHEASDRLDDAAADLGAYNIGPATRTMNEVAGLIDQMTARVTELNDELVAGTLEAC